MPSDAPSNSRSPTASGFGKVLSSVQGLQQRLDDFSVDELSHAHAQAYALIQRLDDVHRQLTAIAKLKESVANANKQISAKAHENFDRIGLADLENHSQLRAIIRIGRLIRMRELLKVAQASSDSAVLDLQRIALPTEANLKQATDAESEAPSHPVPSPLVDNPPAPGYAVEPLIDNFISGTPDQSETGRATLDPEPLTTPAVPVDAPVCESPAVELDASNPMGQPVDARSRQPQAAYRIPEDASSAVRPNFDQRLLKDLIQTYGEFALAGTATKSVESATIPPPDVRERSQAEVDPTSEATTAAEPAFLRSRAGGLLALPAPQEEPAAQSSSGMQPKMRKQGDLDRQLKNIIKDYGEYDLYPPQKSLNLKVAAIAAFAMLSLLLAIFYFFTPSPSETPVAVESTPAGIKEAPQSGR